MPCGQVADERWEDKPWIGVDMDGTLVKYTGQTHEIGEPIPEMIRRVKTWLKEGKRVKIMTARVGTATGKHGMGGTPSFIAEQIVLIRHFCMEHFGQWLEITCSKDFKMVELWDDCAIQVIKNTGKRAD